MQHLCNLQPYLSYLHSTVDNRSVERDVVAAALVDINATGSRAIHALIAERHIMKLNLRHCVRLDPP